MAANTSSGTATVSLPTDEQILITREFDAPKHLLFRAFAIIDSGMEARPQDALDLLEEVALSLR